jgi:hypothetical protein
LSKLTREQVEAWKQRFNTRDYEESTLAELNALCDMALLSLREAEPVGQFLKLTTQSGDTEYVQTRSQVNGKNEVVPLFAHPPSGVREGWQLVPVEPTEAMLDAAADRSHDGHPPLLRIGYEYANMRELWKAMLAALAPSGASR